MALETLVYDHWARPFGGIVEAECHGNEYMLEQKRYFLAAKKKEGWDSLVLKSHLRSHS